MTSSYAEELMMDCRMELAKHPPESKNAEAYRRRLDSLRTVYDRALRNGQSIAELRKVV